MMKKKGAWNFSIKWIIIIIILVLIVSVIVTVIIYKIFVKTPEKDFEDKTSGTLNINVRNDMSESQGTLNINVVGNESQ